MKLFGKIFTSFVLLAVLCISPVASGVFGVQARAATQEAAAQTTAPPATATAQNNNNLLGWGVFLYAAGEVAATVAMGIAHARKVKRAAVQEELRQRQPVKDTNLLPLYAAYKEALAGAK